MLWSRKPSVMLHEVPVASPVSVDHCPHDAQAIANRILVLPVPGHRPIGENALNFELTRINQESHQRLFVVRIASGIGLDDQSQAGIGGDWGPRSQNWHPPLRLQPHRGKNLMPCKDLWQAGLQPVPNL